MSLVRSRLPDRSRSSCHHTPALPCRWLSIWITALSLVATLHAAAHAEPVIEYLTIDDGLSDSYITSIIQDKFGYLWFGTMDGLNRYDGRSFVLFQNLPGDSRSLSDNHVRSLAEDSRGDLFIATNTAGMNIFRRDQDRFVRANLKDPQGRINESLSVVKCAADGIVWIGSQEGSLLRYNAARDSVEWSLTIDKDFENRGANIISDIYPAGEDSLWIASGLGGLDLVIFPKGQVSHILLADTLEEPFRRNGCVGIVEDATGLLWISRVSGLDSYRPDTGEHQHFGFHDSKGEMLKGFNLLQDNEGQILLNSYYDLIRFDPATGGHELIASILPQYFTPALILDKGGILWAGTMGWGAVKLDPRKGEFNTSPGNYLPELFPKTLALLSDSVGLDMGLRDRNFLSIIRDRQGLAWVATQYWGLYRVDEGSGEIRKYTLGEPDIRHRYQVMYEVFEDCHGEIWVSTVGGLSKLDRVTGRFQYHRLYPGWGMAKFCLNKRDYLDISCIYQDHEDIFWLGTPELGLIRFDPSNDSLRYFPIVYPQDQEARSFCILSIAEDPQAPDAVLWLGTEGGGLVRFDKGDHGTTFITMAQGLPNNIVNSILPGEQGSLWLSTNMGLSRFLPSSGTLVNYDVRDGLQSNGFNRREGFRTAPGELFFGGTYGYNHFFPGNIREDLNTAPIVLTGIDILNEALHFGDPDSILTTPLTLLQELSLDHRQAMMVTFSFTALNYSNPHRDQFAYKLDGFDERWIRNGPQRDAVYTNLNPGNYRFRVRYLRDIEAEEPPELSLALIILPPYWKTWWFRSVIVVILVGLSVALVRNQLKKLQRKRSQQQHFSQQLLEYQEQERKRISGELHDGIGQDLLIIKNTLQLGLNSLATGMPVEEHIRSASETVSRSIREVREISHNLSPQHLEQLGLTSTIDSVLEAVERSTQMVFDVELDDVDGLLAPEQEIMLYRIIQESLSNVIKHSQASRVQFSLRRNETGLLFEISDNGVGISPGQLKELKGIGLAGMAERARLLHGHLEITQASAGGTSLRLRIDLEGRPT